LSFGYWTTNFVEVQRAMASKSINAARLTPIIGAFPKMLIPFIVVVPGMIAAVLVPQMTQFKEISASIDEATALEQTGVTYNDALLLLMREVLPNGLLGVAIAGLLAAFMAGMAANISAFNTVFSYDLWQQYVVKDREDDYYLKIGRWATIGACVVAIFTALIAGNFSNLMDYLQTLFGFFNAPLFATFILGMFWKRMSATAGWVGLVGGTLSAVFVFILAETGVLDLPGQGAAFLAASTAFVVDIVLSVIVTLFTTPKPAAELRGLVYSETPKSDFEDLGEPKAPFWKRPVPVAGVALVLVIILNVTFG
ncbi:MAG: sodium:solute symporter family transporter, partial [Brevibacterium sp.]